MYSVLLVDDEPSVLTGLRYVIDWDEYGVEIAEIGMKTGVVAVIRGGKPGGSCLLISS